MATYDSRAKTTARKIPTSMHEFQFIGKRDAVAAGDIVTIYKACPGTLVDNVALTVFTAEGTAVTANIGDTATPDRYFSAANLNVAADPVLSGTAPFLYTTEDTIQIVFSADAKNVEFAVNVLVRDFIAEKIVEAGGVAK